MKAVVVANLRASPGKSAILGIGCIVLVVLLVRLAAKGPQTASAELTPDVVADPAGLIPPENEPADAVVVAPGPRLPRPQTRQTVARDPFAVAWLGTFAPGAAEEEAPLEERDELRLQLVMTGQGPRATPVAVISGVVVYPGSWIAGFEVVEIGKRYVTLRNAAETIQIQLP
jgi:hypothetical protein